MNLPVYRTFSVMLLSSLLWASQAGANAVTTGAPKLNHTTERDTQNHINLRGGAGSNNANGRPLICMQVSATESLSFETCGTGSGFLHKDPAPEMAHFRLKWAVERWESTEGALELQAGIGFSELQIGQDQPGFSFGSPGQPGAVETAGPETSMSLQWIYPIGLGLELIGDATLGAAWFEHAPALLTPRQKLAPFGEITAGVGW